MSDILANSDKDFGVPYNALLNDINSDTDCYL